MPIIQSNSETKIFLKIKIKFTSIPQSGWLWFFHILKTNMQAGLNIIVVLKGNNIDNEQKEWEGKR